MNKLFNYFGLLLCFVLAVSCDPAVADDGGLLFGVNEAPGTEVPGGGNTTQKKLSKITALDDDDKEYNINFSYNGDDLIGITTSNNTFVYTITYNTDKKISTIKKVETIGGGTTINTINLTYTDGKLTKTQRIIAADGDESKLTGAVTYNSNGWPTQFKETMMNPSNPTQEIANIKSDLQYDGNNLSKWNLKFTTDPSFPVGIFGFDLDTSFSNYDTQKNPFRLLPKDFNIAVLHLETERQGPTGFSLNNMKTIKTVTNLGTFTGNLVYVYDKDGYVTTSSAEGQVVQKFEYK